MDIKVKMKIRGSQTWFGMFLLEAVGNKSTRGGSVTRSKGPEVGIEMGCELGVRGQAGLSKCLTVRELLEWVARGSDASLKRCSLDLCCPIRQPLACAVI